MGYVGRGEILLADVLVGIERFWAEKYVVVCDLVGGEELFQFWGEFANENVILKVFGWQFFEMLSKFLFELVLMRIPALSIRSTRKSGLIAEAMRCSLDKRWIYFLLFYRNC